jgi:ribosomal protein L19
MLFIIKPDGKIEVMTQGFTGSACQSETEALLKMVKDLGVEVTTVTNTPTAEANKVVEQDRVKQRA